MHQGHQLILESLRTFFEPAYHSIMDTLMDVWTHRLDGQINKLTVTFHTSENHLENKL